MEGSVVIEQRQTSICLSRKSCQHTPSFWCNAHQYWGPAAKKPKNEPRASSPDLGMRRSGNMNAVPAHTAPAPSMRKPVSPTSSAAQASSIRGEVACQNRDWKEISLSIDLLYRRSLVPCDDRKEFIQGRKLMGSLSSHHQSDRVRMNVMYHVPLLHRMDFSSRKDQVSDWRPFA